MQLKVFVSEEEFLSGKILSNVEPPILEFYEQKGDAHWGRSAKIEDLHKLPQFSGINEKFLLALKDVVDNFSE